MGISDSIISLYDFDNENRKKYKTICGVDEAGRGPLAGDVYAAAVVLDEKTIIEGLDDSKKLSEKKRESLYDEIIQKAKTYCIATASIAEIEEINILQATMLAMKRAIEGLEIEIDCALIDGNSSPNLSCNAKTVVKGDMTSASIAAASILAKVSRDRYMLKMAEMHPEYCFEKHKGYATKLHYERLMEYGISEIHRPSFLKKLIK